MKNIFNFQNILFGGVFGAFITGIDLLIFSKITTLGGIGIFLVSICLVIYFIRFVAYLIYNVLKLIQ